MPDLIIKTAWRRDDPQHAADAVASWEKHNLVLGARLGGYMRRTIEAWALEHPEEDVKGFGGVITAAEFGEKQREPVWHDWGVNIAVAGYLPGGEQSRIGWFAHARS